VPQPEIPILALGFSSGVAWSELGWSSGGDMDGSLDIVWMELGCGSGVARA
jgi:hypothetical protein